MTSSIMIHKVYSMRQVEEQLSLWFMDDTLLGKLINEFIKHIRNNFCLYLDISIKSSKASGAFLAQVFLSFIQKHAFWWICQYCSSFLMAISRHIMCCYPFTLIVQCAIVLYKEWAVEKALYTIVLLSCYAMSFYQWCHHVVLIARMQSSQIIEKTGKTIMSSCILTFHAAQHSSYIMKTIINYQS